MSAREEALALLRERFPEPWELRRQTWLERGVGYIGWSASFGDGECGVMVDALGGTTEDEAVRNLIAAWDEATKGERTLVVSAARGIALEAVDDMAAAGHRAVDIAVAALAAERALSDRLAEALADCGEHQRGCPWARFEAGRPTESGGYEMQYAGKWYEVKPNDCRPACTCGLNKALAAHAERRKA